uniref:ComEC/Rec2 family competence protein n=1 Tax=Allorhizocola rhizosphaerae TaxID=1872709 RepID=UPI0013C2C006
MDSSPVKDGSAHGSRGRGGSLDLRLAPLALGCWAAALSTLHAGLRVGLVLGGVAFLAGGVAVTRRWQWRWIVVAGAVGVACGAVTTAARLSAATAPELAALVAERATVEVELSVSDDPRLSRSGTWVVPARLRAVDALAMDVGVLVLSEHEGWRGLLPGQRVRATVRFGPAGAGDLKAAVLSSSSAPTRLGVPSWAQRAAASLRAGLQVACEPLDDGPGGLLPGLVVGDTSRLPAEVEQQFRDVGLTHLNAVSGSNVAIVVGFVILVARWCRLGPRWAAGLSLVAIVGFVILVRPSPSVLRAAAMGGVGLLALAGGRSRAALPALCATVAVLVVVDPELAGDAGFALSVLATSGLLMIAPRMRDALRRKGVPAGVAEALAIPASAQLACAPVVAGLSGTISLVAIPANLLAVPAIAPATLTGVAAAVVSPVWPDAARFAAWLGGWPAWWLVKIGEVGSGVPAGVLAWPGGVGGALLLAGLTVVALLGFRYRRVRLIVVVLGVAVA